MSARRHLRRTVPALVLIVLAAVTAAGCSSGSGSSAAASGGITVTDAWARPSAGTDASAAYFTIHNDSATNDVLTAVSTPIATAEMHETMAGDSGMMGMQPMSDVAIPAGKTVEFKPGGLHVMLTKPAAPIQAGQTIQLTLTFQKAGQVTVTAQVRAQ